jgi:hypothetical protein
MQQPSFYKDLQSLKLWCTFSILDFSFCQNIPIVDLFNTSNVLRNELYPSLPVLYGNDLKIRHFSLASWNGQTLSNVVICELRYCTGLINFPAMEALQSLELENCVAIPSLSSLTLLFIRDCPMLERISFCPNLVKAEILKISKTFLH